jgi:hypothetical protein
MRLFDITIRRTEDLFIRIHADDADHAIAAATNVAAGRTAHAKYEVTGTKCIVTPLPETLKEIRR